MLLIYLIIFISAELNLAHRDTIPVFLIDYERVMDRLFIDTNPFTKTSTTYFADIVHDAIKLSEIVIIFAEELFCAEDVSTKDKLGTPYHHLGKGLQENKVKYIPNVVEPFKLLNQIFRPQHNNVFYFSSGTKQQMFDGHFKYFYIFFQDGANETRAETLRRHDLIIREVYFVVRQLALGPVVAFYTGKTNPVVVEKIDYSPFRPSPTRANLGVNIETDGALFRFIEVHTETPVRRATFKQLPTVTEETWTRDKLITNMAYTDFELSFNFSFKKDGWILENVALLEGGEEVGRTEMAVGAPWMWAYYCGEPLVLLNTRDGSAVTIGQYKIQPFKSNLCYPGENCYKQTPSRWSALEKHSEPRAGRNGGSDYNDSIAGGSNWVRDTRRMSARDDGDKRDDVGGGEDGVGGEGDGVGADDAPQKGKCFGKTINCGPYFNTHILSGLFVVGICLIILMYGIVALYNCSSNDRFDDPYGRTLVVTSVDTH
ncbi:uncharacterized protein LOC113510059 [Galleria mellonella]|uniref:Uncharacterized protein LOC113510059 n=1 Tax=Galleria mellonella TaxID=7137 RepID=A0A6J3C114_GALME|nr:uncharacterized protein LOC113510059 [Galleria mellonella]